MRVQQRPVGDVGVVELHSLVPGDVAAPEHLPEAREARPEFLAGELPRLEGLDLERPQRAWSHEAHLAAQDVDELRQLVEARLAQEATETA